MNKASSRSHCLFTIQVHGKISLLDGEGDMEFTGKLHMVDLAGSEVSSICLVIPVASSQEVILPWTILLLLVVLIPLFSSAPRVREMIRAALMRWLANGSG